MAKASSGKKKATIFYEVRDPRDNTKFYKVGRPANRSKALNK